MRLAALLIILVAAIYVVSSSRFIRTLGEPGVRDVSEVLEGEVTEGSVSIRGIVDLVEPENNVLFLKDLKRQEVCIDSVYLFAVIKVHTRAVRRRRRGRGHGSDSAGGWLPGHHHELEPGEHNVGRNRDF